jgi:4-hydroxy-tetrahydrodipicolinate synthase
MPVFTGVGVALVTLFDDEGELDAPATASLAVRLVDAGVRAVVVAGTTGEAATLDADERMKLLEAVRASVPASVPVIAGTGAPSARQAERLTRDAIGHGAGAMLTLSPPGSSDLPGYYAAVTAAAGSAPVLAYHFPAVSAPGIPVDALADLPVAGVKDSSGDAARLLDELDAWDRPVYTGSSALLSFAGPLGCAGAILSLANVEPERCIEAFGGDAGAQRALTLAHSDAHEDFPRGLKAMVADRFGTSPVTRVG